MLIRHKSITNHQQIPNIICDLMKNIDLPG